MSALSIANDEEFRQRVPKPVLDVDKLPAPAPLSVRRRIHVPKPVPDINKAPSMEKQSVGSQSAETNMNLAETWGAILSIIDDEYSLLAANLRNSALSTVYDNKIVIDIHGSKISMDILRQEKNLTTLKNICSTFFKKEMEISLNHINKPKPEQRPRQRPKTHPLVMDALDIFGGDIVNTTT